MKLLWESVEDSNHVQLSQNVSVSVLYQTHTGNKTRCERKAHWSTVNKLTNLVKKTGCHTFKENLSSWGSAILKPGLEYKRPCQGGYF